MPTVSLSTKSFQVTPPPKMTSSRCSSSDQSASSLLLDRVQVAVRCRPPSLRGKNGVQPRTFPPHWICDNTIRIPMNDYGALRSFSFNHVFPPAVTQVELFKSVVQPALDDVLSQKRDISLLAYGQTGTGKSYTLGLLPSHSPRVEQEGIVPRSLMYCLERLETLELKMTLSCVQIYMNAPMDLLVTKKSSSKMEKLKIRHDKNKGFFVDGLVEVPIETLRDAQLVLSLALENRVLATTNRNSTSSRSHTILSLLLRSQQKSTRLMFVDLAGSERVHPSSNHPTRMKETRHINASLSALGNVISALAKKEKPSHVRYRDTTLTKLLEHSLKKGQVILIATIDETYACMHETLSTLKFAARCKNIQADDVLMEKSVDTAQDMLLKKAYSKLQVEYDRMCNTIASREREIHSMYATKIRDIEVQSSFKACPQESIPSTGGDVGPEENEELISKENIKEVKSFSDATAAAYYALCDIANRTLTEQIGHPEIASFEQETWLISYIIRLYAVIMDSLVRYIIKLRVFIL